jgi:Tfp pilus assembly protein PilF
VKEFTLPTTTARDRRNYQVDPMEYIFLRIRGLDFGKPDELSYLMLKVRYFLSNANLPSEYCVAFFRRLAALATSGDLQARHNAQHVLRDLRDDIELAAEAVAHLSEVGLWTLVEEDYQRRSDAAALAMQQRRQPAIFTMPGSDGKRIYYAAGPYEAERMRIDSIGTEDSPADDAAFDEGAVAMRLMVEADDPTALADMAWLHVRRNDIERAVPYFERLCEVRPLDALFHAQYGMVLVKAGRVEEGLEELEAALRLDPDRPTTLMNKAQVLVHLERNAEAGAAARSAVRMNVCPEHPLAFELVSGLAASAAVAGDCAAASELADAAIQMRPDSEQALLLRASIAQAQGDDPVAETQNLDSAVDLDDASAQAWTMRAAHLMRSGDPAGAVASYTRAVQLDSDNGQLWNDFGSCLQRIGDHDQARQCYKKAVALDPDDAMHWSNLGGAVLNQAKTTDDIGEATRLMTKALEMNPDEVGAIFGLAVIALRLGEYAKAEAGLNNVLHRDPNHHTARQLLERLRTNTPEGQTW